MTELEPERRRQAVEAVFLPEVEHLGPSAGRADDAPHAEAELVAVVLRHRAEVRRHVVHVVGAVVPDDVDELVDVDVVVHEPQNYHVDHV